MNWQKFQDKIVSIIEKIDEDKAEFRDYAMTYALNIMANLEEGRAYGMSDEEATRTQMLYVVSNLEDAPIEVLKEINEVCKGMNVDVSEVIYDIISN